MPLISFNLFSDKWKGSSSAKEVCWDLLKWAPKFTIIHVVVSLRLCNHSHTVCTCFQKPFSRAFPWLRLIFPDLQNSHWPKTSTMQTSTFCFSFLLLEFNRFSDLSRTSYLFPRLFSPEKCHNKILGPSWFSRTWKKLVHTSCFGQLDEPQKHIWLILSLDHNYIFKYQIIIFSMRSGLFLCRVEIYTSKVRVVFEVHKVKIYLLAGINFHIQVTIIHYERKKQPGVFS